MEAVTIYEQTLGPVHPDTGKAYAQLAMMLFRTENVQDAKAYQQKAIIAIEGTCGIDDPETLNQYVQ